MYFYFQICFIIFLFIVLEKILLRPIEVLNFRHRADCLIGLAWTRPLRIILDARFLSSTTCPTRPSSSPLSCATRATAKPTSKLQTRKIPRCAYSESRRRLAWLAPTFLTYDFSHQLVESNAFFIYNTSLTFNTSVHAHHASRNTEGPGGRGRCRFR